MSYKANSRSSDLTMGTKELVLLIGSLVVGLLAITSFVLVLTNINKTNDLQSSGIYTGKIDMYAGEDPLPTGWLECNGDLVSKTVYSDLYNVIGTFWDTKSLSNDTHFALPDLRGRSPVGVGNSTTSTSARSLGEVGGVEEQTLSVQQMPRHTHRFRVGNEGKGAITVNTAANNYLGDATGVYRETVSDPGQFMGNDTISEEGGDSPISLMHPYYAVRYIIKF